MLCLFLRSPHRRATSSASSSLNSPSSLVQEIRWRCRWSSNRWSRNCHSVMDGSIAEDTDRQLRIVSKIKNMLIIVIYGQLNNHVNPAISSTFEERVLSLAGRNKYVRFQNIPKTLQQLYLKETCEGKLCFTSTLPGIPRRATRKPTKTNKQKNKNNKKDEEHKCHRLHGCYAVCCPPNTLLAPSASRVEDATQKETAINPGRCALHSKPSATLASTRLQISQHITPLLSVPNFSSVNFWRRIMFIKSIT